MCRMRSIQETADFFRDMDDKTQITESTLRKMIAEGSIPFVKTGKKYLINLDALLDMFNAPVNGFQKVRPAEAGLFEKMM